MTKQAFGKRVSASFKRLFHARNIIIVSPHKVGHIPISGKAQVFVAMTVIGFFSVVSYLTGGYMAADAIIADRERRLHESEVEKKLMDKDFSMLKRDLTKLRTNGKELSDYSKFILGQHGAHAAAQQKKSPQSGKDTNNPLNWLSEANAGGDEKLFDRIRYLEERVNEIRTDNEQLISAIRERTEGRIDLFEDIIAETGLNMPVMESSVEREKPAKPERVAVKAPIQKNAPATKTANIGGQGGPFIPYNPSFSRDEAALLGDIERLTKLYQIIDAIPLGLPISRYQEASGYGRRIDPFTRKWAMHTGLDMAGRYNAEIVAANDGKVIAAGRNGAYGNMIDITHGLGLSTRYAHLGKVLVREGDKVKQGQIIGIQGSTGRSTGLHLHYEVRYHNRPIDPKKFLNARLLYVSRQD